MCHTFHNVFCVRSVRVVCSPIKLHPQSRRRNYFCHLEAPWNASGDLAACPRAGCADLPRDPAFCADDMSALLPNNCVVGNRSHHVDDRGCPFGPF